jgi:hypothetical protein
MKWVALITWVLTAGLGFVMLAIWLARGGMQQARDGGSRIRAPLILSHFLLAAGGLVVWIIYLVADKSALAWIAFVILAVVALLGWTMFFVWAGQRQRSLASAQPGGAAVASEPPEQHFPVVVIVFHGLFAVATVVLVFLTAIGIGGS